MPPSRAAWLCFVAIPRVHQSLKKKKKSTHRGAFTMRIFKGLSSPYKCKPVNTPSSAGVHTARPALGVSRRQITRTRAQQCLCTVSFKQSGAEDHLDPSKQVTGEAARLCMPELGRWTFCGPAVPHQQPLQPSLQGSQTAPVPSGTGCSNTQHTPTQSWGSCHLQLMDGSREQTRDFVEVEFKG